MGDASESFSEGFKLLAKHPRFFVSIQLMFMLPLAFLEVVSEYYVYWTLYNAGITDGSAKDDGSGDASKDGGGVHLGSFISFVCTAGIAVFWAPFLSLPSAAILHLVGLNSGGRSQSVSLMDGFRACVPRLWMRLSATNICRTSVLCLIFVVLLGTLTGLDDYAARKLFFVMFIGTIIAIFWFDVVFRPAAGVAVLGAEPGRAVVKRSWELLKAGPELAGPELGVVDELYWATLVVVFFLPFQQAFWDQVANNGSCPWGLLIAYTIVRSFLMLVEPLVQGFQYALLKKYYDEDHPQSVGEVPCELA